jgi:hypothetical protein
VRRMADHECVVRPGDGMRFRVIDRRTCAYCGDRDAVIVHSGHSMAVRATMKYCSKRCARRGEKNSEGRRQFSTRRAVLELLAAFERQGINGLDTAAATIYDRAYRTGYLTGKRSGTNLERRRIVRLVAEKRAQAQKGRAA